MTPEQLYLDLLAAWGTYPLDEEAVREIITKNLLITGESDVQRSTKAAN